MLRVIVPLLLGLFDPVGLAGRDLKRADKARAENVADAAARTLTQVGRLMMWPHYHAVLMLLLKRLRHGSEARLNISVRALNALLGGFHFDTSTQPTGT